MGTSSDLSVAVGAASGRGVGVSSAVTPGSSGDTHGGSDHSAAVEVDARVVNVRGAYPLFLIGAALLAYGVLVSIQTPGATLGRFEIWPLLVVLGITVLGAGVFSLYFAIEDAGPTPEVQADRGREEPPPVPRPASPRPASVKGAGVSTTPGATPPWWEGLPETTGASKTHPRPRTLGTAKPGAASMEPRAAARSPSVSPPATPKVLMDESRDEVESTLKELEAISREISSSTPPPAIPPVSGPRVSRCSDCGEPLASSATLICEECGTRLCANCAKETALSTGVVTCRSCRKRTERERTSLRGTAPGALRPGAASRKWPESP